MKLENIIEQAALYLFNPNFVSPGKRIQILAQYAREELSLEPTAVTEFIDAFDERFVI